MFNTEATGIPKSAVLVGDKNQDIRLQFSQEKENGEEQLHGIKWKDQIANFGFFQSLVGKKVKFRCIATAGEFKLYYRPLELPKIIDEKTGNTISPHKEITPTNK